MTIQQFHDSLKILIKDTNSLIVDIEKLKNYIAYGKVNNFETLFNKVSFNFSYLSTLYTRLENWCQWNQNSISPEVWKEIADEYTELLCYIERTIKNISKYKNGVR